mgnify:CR=1 FL=1
MGRKKLRAVMKLKLGAVRGMSRRKLSAQLLRVARDVNRSKNAMQLYWLQRRQAHPEWAPEQSRDKKGQLKFDENGKPEMEPQHASQQLGKEMYREGRRISPHINTSVLSLAHKALLGRLADRVPYDHDGDADYVWEAILAFERSMACYRSRTVPVPNNSATLLYCGQSAKKLSPGVLKRTRDFAGSSAVVRFPLWSRLSGYKTLDVVARIHCRDLGNGNRRLLRKVISGELKFCDSSLVYKDGEWFFHLSYEVPIVDHHLDQERVATVYLGASGKLMIDFAGERCEQLGHYAMLESEYRRLVIRRKSQRYRSRYGSGRGHGKGRFYLRLRPYAHRWSDMQGHFRNQMLSRLISQCRFHNCGTVRYREPGLGLRNLSWFAKTGVPICWTTLLNTMTFMCRKNSIVFETARMHTAEWKGEAPAWKPPKKRTKRKRKEKIKSA